MGIIAFAVVLFLLVQAKFILISLAIAIILFSLTSDAINSIQRMKIGNLRVTNWVASVLAVVLIASGLLTMAGLVISQINTVLTTTLAYTDDAQRAIAQMFAWMGEDVEASVLATVRSIEISGYLRSAAGQAGSLLSQVVLIILFVGFLFAERVWFNTKLENLMGDTAQAGRVNRIIGSIIRRVNRYLLVKALISAVTGALIFALVSVFNLQFAAAMGLLTFVLNFIPSVGSIIATLVLTLVAYIQVTEPSTAVLIFVIGRHDPVSAGKCHRPDADGQNPAPVIFRDHHLAGFFLGRGLGRSGHVPCRALHGRSHDRLLAYSRRAARGGAVVARRAAGRGIPPVARPNSSKCGRAPIRQGHRGGISLATRAPQGVLQHEQPYRRGESRIAACGVNPGGQRVQRNPLARGNGAEFLPEFSFKRDRCAVPAQRDRMLDRARAHGV